MCVRDGAKGTADRIGRCREEVWKGRMRRLPGVRAMDRRMVERKRRMEEGEPWSDVRMSMESMKTVIGSPPVFEVAG